MHAQDFQAFLFATGVLVWTLGIYSQKVNAYIAPPLLIMAAGLGLGFLTPQPEKLLLSYLETLSWLAVGFGVTGIALRLNAEEIRRM